MMCHTCVCGQMKHRNTADPTSLPLPPPELVTTTVLEWERKEVATSHCRVAQFVKYSLPKEVVTQYQSLPCCTVCEILAA